MSPMDGPSGEDRPTYVNMTHGGGGSADHHPWSVARGSMERRRRRNRRFTVVQFATFATWAIAMILTLVTSWGHSTWLPLAMIGTVIMVTVVGCAWAIHGGRK